MNGRYGVNGPESNVPNLKKCPSGTGRIRTPDWGGRSKRLVNVHHRAWWHGKFEALLAEEMGQENNRRGWLRSVRQLLHVLAARVAILGGPAIRAALGFVRRGFTEGNESTRENLLL